MTHVLSPVVVRPIGVGAREARRWEVVQPLLVESDALGGELMVPAGERTDFNSTPWFLWWLMPPQDFLEAGVGHDDLYKRGTFCGRPIERLTADNYHRELLIWGQAPRWKQILYRGGLRACGWIPWNGYRRLQAEAQ